MSKKTRKELERVIWTKYGVERGLNMEGTPYAANTLTKEQEAKTLDDLLGELEAAK